MLTVWGFSVHFEGLFFVVVVLWGVYCMVWGCLFVVVSWLVGFGVFLAVEEYKSGKKKINTYGTYMHFALL